MASKRDEEIVQTFREAWDEFGDEASTTFLISVTSEREGCSYGRVVDALAACGRGGEA